MNVLERLRKNLSYSELEACKAIAQCMENDTETGSRHCYHRRDDACDGWY